MGLSVNGITYSVIASQIVATAMLGGPDPDADLIDRDWTIAIQMAMFLA